MVSWLTEELVALGHDVTLFASGDSKTSGRLVAACPISLWRDPDVRETLPQHVRMLELVLRELPRFDVIHFHCDYLHFPLVRRLACANVTTLHGQIHLHDVEDLFREHPEVPLVSISDAQRRPLPEANWQGTVYHGLPRDLHTFQPHPANYLAFLGRISPEKRLDRAIEIARRAGVPLKIAAKIYDEDQAYFQSAIAPLLQKYHAFVEFIGEVGGERKNEFLRGASALLFPIDWPEPFGLVMIEALACGTPVIAWRNGSVPELVRNGVTGFVVDSIEEAIASVRRIPEIVRSDCRRGFEERFDSRRMAMEYITIYRTSDCRQRTAAPPFTPRSVLCALSRKMAPPRVTRSGPAFDSSGDGYYSSCLTDGRVRVLKHGDTFAVFDHYGNIKPVPKGEEGVYHDGTRFVSCLLLELDGGSPFFLSSTIRDDNDQLTVALTNPDMPDSNAGPLPLGSLHIARRIFLWRGACYQEIAIENYAGQTVTTRLKIRCGADYADIFEIRGMERKSRGESFPSFVADQTIIWSYRGLDGIERRTRFEFSPPADLSSAGAIFELSLDPRKVVRIYVTARCELGEADGAHQIRFEEARSRTEGEIGQSKSDACRVYSSNGQFNAWVDRARADLHMMSTTLPTGPYPYAGVPWFNTPFGRDGLITAFECLWFWPDLARGVLSYLAEQQATATNAAEDAEPGKIVHEIRKGEMAAVKQMPFGRYYGAVDGTPLFILLAGAYYDRTGDLSFIKDIWPNIHAAVRWIEQFGDRDGDGFVEYCRQSTDGLIHQGWKDGDEAIFHNDGSDAVAPVALCEVQSYVYGAWQAAARLADGLGLHEQAALPRRKAELLRDEFNRVFWCEEISSFALALEARKRPCRVRASNAGHALISGIATRDHALRVGRSLMDPRSFSGWGIRTVAEGEARYNPMAYHNGSVWPHDNALIAYGFSRYGLTLRGAGRL